MKSYYKYIINCLMLVCFEVVLLISIFGVIQNLVINFLIEIIVFGICIIYFSKIMIDYAQKKSKFEFYLYWFFIILLQPYFLFISENPVIMKLSVLPSIVAIIISIISISKDNIEAVCNAFNFIIEIFIFIGAFGSFIFYGLEVFEKSEKISYLIFPIMFILGVLEFCEKYLQFTHYKGEKKSMECVEDKNILWNKGYKDMNKIIIQDEGVKHTYEYFIEKSINSSKESFKCSSCFKYIFLILPLSLFLFLPFIFYKFECSFLKIFENPVFLICLSLITITVIICITKIIIEHDLKERKIKEIDKIFNQHQDLIFNEYEKKEIKIDFFKYCINAISDI